MPAWASTLYALLLFWQGEVSLLASNTGATGVAAVVTETQRGALSPQALLAVTQTSPVPVPFHWTVMLVPSDAPWMLPWAGTSQT